MTKRDVLNRDNDVNLIFNIIENYSESKEYVSFGLDGEQGVGKTFVVEQINNKLNETKENDEPKYFVINYNCWENDYYSDPLNSILISINNTIEESKDKFSEAFNKVLIEVAKDLAGILLNGLTSIYPTVGTAINYGLSIKTRIDNQKDVVESIDDNINLKKVLSKVRENIRKITENKTIVIIIDELDRCLPEYQIKVLERLHHVFSELNNTIQITVFDKKLIENSIFSIFGNNISVDRYLDKFIAFLLNIGHGQCQQIILDEYPGLFGTKSMTIRDKEFIKDLISSSKINIRSIKKMLSNLELINKVIKVDFEHQNYVGILEFEIVVILFRLSMRSLREVKRGTNIQFDIARESQILRKIMKNENLLSSYSYNSNYADTINDYFRKMKIMVDERRVVNTIFDGVNNNILLCKVLLSLNYNLDLYTWAINLESDSPGICENAIKYIDMIYPE